jgi:hypothetical protein
MVDARHVGLLVVFAAALAGPATAQTIVRPVTPDSFTQGAHVRAVIRSDGTTLDGFVKSVNHDTLLIASCKTCADGVPAPLVTLRDLQLERRRAKNGAGRIAVDMLKGLFYGALVGAGVGGIAAYYETSKPDCRELCGLDWLLVPYVAAIGGASGLVTGGIIGVAQRESYWVRVTIPVSAR